MNIILLGPQGSGKGTQAALLAEKFALKHFSLGDELRAQVEQKTTLGLKAEPYMLKGRLVPDSIIKPLVKQFIKENPGGIIFDGFPRSLEQAHFLDELVKIDAVVELRLSDEEALKRITGRRQCQNCKKIYGWAEGPQEPGICDECGGKLVQREDDKPEVVKARLKVYHGETEPLLEYYKPRDIVFSVDGSKSVEEVFKQVCEVLAGL